MLQAMRDKTKGWIAYVIVAVLVVPFALFGVYNYFTGGQDPTVAEVNGDAIQSTDLRNAVQQQQQRLRQMMGDRYDPSMFDDSTLKRQALDQLITRRLLQDFVDEEGLIATDSMVAAQLQQVPAFQQNGRFSADLYRRVLRQNRIPVEQYENGLRQQGALSQLSNAVSSSAIITDAELARVAAVQFEERDLAWLRIDAAELRTSIELDDNAVQSYYDEHRDAFQRPRQVRLSYLVLDSDSVAEGITISEKELRNRYEENRQQYQTPTRRRVSHILLQVPEDADEEAVQAARKRLVDLRQRITSGDLTFSEAARQVSEDPGSSEDGGSLGIVQPGDMVEPFEEAAFDLDKGAVSEPVRTQFGWHLIKVTDVTPSGTRPFEEVRDELRRTMAEELASKRLFELANQLGNLSYENPKTLKPAADALGLEVQQTGWVARNGSDASGIAGNEKVLETVFSPEVLEQGRNSDVLTLDDGRRVALRVQDVRPATVLPLDEVRDRVRDRLLAQRARERAEEKGKQVAGDLRDGKSLDELADGETVQLQQPGWVGRRGGGLPPPVAQTAFSMPVPEKKDAVTVDQVGLGDSGDYAVLTLRGVRHGELEKLSDPERSQLVNALRQTDASSSQQDLIAALREDADIEIYDSRL